MKALIFFYFRLMTTRFLILLSLLIIVSNSHAQNKWSTSIDFGASIPIGKFKNQSTEHFTGQMPNNELGFQGFLKKDNGFAKTGFAGKIAITRSLSEFFEVGILFSYSKHEVNTEKMNSIWQDEFDQSLITVNHDPYETVSAIPLAAFSLFQSQSLNVKATVGYGASNLNFPYWFYVVPPVDPDRPVISENRSEKDNIWAGMLLGGLSASINLTHQLALGISGNYSSANFQFKEQNRSTNVFDIDYWEDEVNYRTFSASVLITYTW